MARVTPAQRRFIREKIRILRHEGRPEAQSIAIAYRMAGVPPRARDLDRDSALVAFAYGIGQRIGEHEYAARVAPRSREAEEYHSAIEDMRDLARRYPGSRAAMIRAAIRHGRMEAKEEIAGAPTERGRDPRPRRRTARDGREVEDLADLARHQGWRVERTRSGHWRFLPPNPSLPAVVASGTPSDWRALRNFRAQLRRSGLALESARDPSGETSASLSRYALGEEDSRLPLALRARAVHGRSRCSLALEARDPAQPAHHTRDARRRRSRP